MAIQLQIQVQKIQSVTTNQINMENDSLKLATFGGGCFWCTEAIYQLTEGITVVEAGYSGGHVDDPTYQQVCGKKTGHAEVIRIQYNSKVISFKEILDILWATHNPTTLNQQGNDIGPQYRSVIFYHNEEQKTIAEQSLKETDASSMYSDPIVTTIDPLINYFKAENYHQNYYNDNREKNSYCTYVVKPKVEKYKKQFKDKLKKD